MAGKFQMLVKYIEQERDIKIKQMLYGEGDDDALTARRQILILDQLIGFSKNMKKEDF